MKEEDMTKVEFETSEEVDVTPTFDTMGLREDLLRGIYAYGGRRGGGEGERGGEKGRGPGPGRVVLGGGGRMWGGAPARFRGCPAAPDGNNGNGTGRLRRFREALGHPAASHQADHQGERRDRPVSGAAGPGARARPARGGGGWRGGGGLCPEGVAGPGGGGDVGHGRRLEAGRELRPPWSWAAAWQGQGSLITG